MPTSAWNDCLVNGAATFNCIPTLFENIVTVAIYFSGIVALFFILYASIRFIFSNADPKKFENARQTLVYALVGLLIVLLSFFAISLISYITGVGCIQSFGLSFGSCN